jgi:hypothetical protein
MTAPKRTFIYFIEQVGNDAVKIGSSKNVNRRVRALQTGSGVQLRVLWKIDGFAWHEKYLHRKFYKHKLREGSNEWFRLSAIRPTIEKIVSGEQKFPKVRPKLRRRRSRSVTTGLLSSRPSRLPSSSVSRTESNNFWRKARKKYAGMPKFRQALVFRSERKNEGVGYRQVLDEITCLLEKVCSECLDTGCSICCPEAFGDEMKKTYTLGGQTYTTKKAISDRCSGLLRATSFSSEDNAFLFDLLALHPESELKIGCGIAGFKVGPDAYGKRCLWLDRIDGSDTDWSFTKCLLPPTHERKVREALRYLVKDQVIRFRDLELTRTNECAITGYPITATTCHVDHIPPDTFLSLVGRFLQIENIEYNEISIKPTLDGSTFTELENRELGIRWQAFHRENAKLRLTTAKANMSQGSGRNV